MTATQLRAGLHLQGLLGPVEGVREDCVIPVVAHAIVRRRGGVAYRVDVRWSDGTAARYLPADTVEVLS